jgi:hypothetical protein
LENVPHFTKLCRTFHAVLKTKRLVYKTYVLLADEKPYLLRRKPLLNMDKSDYSLQYIRASINAFAVFHKLKLEMSISKM